MNVAEAAVTKAKSSRVRVVLIRRLRSGDRLQSLNASSYFALVWHLSCRGGVVAINRLGLGKFLSSSSAVACRNALECESLLLSPGFIFAPTWQRTIVPFGG